MVGSGATRAVRASDLTEAGAPVASRRAGLRVWHRDIRLALALVVLASVLEIGVAFSGPSAMTLQLGPRNGSILPPWFLPTRMFYLDDRSATIALWASVAVGALGMVVALRALAEGWVPRHFRRLVGLGVALNIMTALVPPVTSADVLMYAAYGRLMRKGIDPYSITPAEISRMEYDAVIRWIERPWTDTPSVYGPVASFTQWLANVLGGDSMHNIVSWLQLFCVVPLVLIGLLAIWLCRREPHARARALMLTLLNPLMIWAVVAGAHNEALGVMFAMAAFTQVRRRPLVAGLLIGLAGGVKVSLVFYGLAVLWAYRRRWRDALRYCAGAAVPIVVGYGLHPAALLAAKRNTGYISTGSWADNVWLNLKDIIGVGPTKVLVTVLSLVGLVVVVAILGRVLPWRPIPGLPPGADPRRDPLTVAARTSVVLCTAWLVTSPYTLSWYDLITWAPLALLGASMLDAMMVWRGAWLSEAFVTGRDLDYPHDIAHMGRIWQLNSPLAQYLVLAVIAGWGGAWVHRRHQLRAATRDDLS